MQSSMEDIIKALLQMGQRAHEATDGPHPDEETISCFLEGKLTAPEAEGVKKHALRCGRCIDLLVTYIKAKSTDENEVPPELLASVINLVKQDIRSYALEIALKLGQEIIEILNTTGDVLVGQEFVPAPLLRSRHIKDFKDEVTVFKDFQDLRVEVKVENRGQDHFDVSITVKEKKTQSAVKNARIALLKDDLEIESYRTDTGRACFEHVLLGKYTVEISSLTDTRAAILLTIEK